jgi:hypothetical protein
VTLLQKLPRGLEAMKAKILLTKLEFLLLSKVWLFKRLGKATA